MAGARKRNRPEDWGDVEPSPVIHLSDLPEHTLEIDLIRMFEKFGQIKDLTMMPHRGQALIEYADISCADKAVSRCTDNPVSLSNHTIRVSFSTSKRIVQRQNFNDGDRFHPDSSQPLETRVLLFTIYNAQYPITVDVISQITARHGRVARIVIFKKKHVQAMVEFKSTQDARNAKRNLNGADIYSGCCTLRIEYARCSRLSVTKNDQETWDFENHSLSTDSGRLRGTEERGTASLMGRFTRSTDRRDGGRPQNGHRDNFVNRSNTLGAMNMAQTSILDQLALAVTPSLVNFGGPDFPGSGRNVSSVIMVYNMDSNQMNCDRLFNILCLYGNVVRIKFLHTKEGSAMAEMGDPTGVERAIRNLSGVPFMNNQLLLRPSKQMTILDVPKPYELHDGTPSFKDYTGCRENRYTNPQKASKNRIYPPSNTLHYWNCPPDFTKDQLHDVFIDAGAKPPTLIAEFPGISERSSSGLVEWDEVADAVEALAFANHYSIPYPQGRFPFVMKLSFSNSPINERPATSRRTNTHSKRRTNSPSPTRYESKTHHGN